MIDGAYYHDIYLFIVSVCTLFCFLKYNSSNGTRIVEGKMSGLVLAILLAFFIGVRPVHIVFADTVGYAEYYNSMLNIPFEFDKDNENLVFDHILTYMASQGFSHTVFFILIAIIYFVGRYISCVKMFPNNSWIAFVIFLGAFLTYTSSVNGIKAGVAASVFVCAIAYREKIWLCALLLAVSWGLHHAMHLCIVAFLIVSFYKNVKVYSFFWIFSLVLAIQHVSTFQTLFAGWTDEKGAGYLAEDADGWLTGMRYDFVLYSSIPIILGWYHKFKRNINHEGYDFILNLYMLTNGVWMLCMYASFTNRIAALSWLLYPLVLVYPYLTDSIPISNRNKKLAILMAYHLLFTLFMHIVYYN